MGLFRFKQFAVQDDRSAMKVGTDGVLLAAWVQLLHHGNALDIGCGSGVISLILAQRFPCLNIQAIDISANAVAETQLNVANSPWSERVMAFQGDAKSYPFSGKFHLIISNPPFFTKATKSGDISRDTTRHDDTLTFEDLLFIANECLSPKGRLVVVYPYDRLESLIKLAERFGFTPTRTCLVKPKHHLAPNRVMLKFGRTSQIDSPSYPSEELVIREADGSFTPEYQQVTRPFYLAF